MPRSALHVMAVTSLVLFLALTGLAWGAPVNLAPLHGVASANDTYVGYPPSNTIDANWETHWGATNYGTAANPFWLQVDLQKSYKVDQIVLVFLHTTNHPGQTNVYNLYTSADGITWNLVSSGTLVDSLDPAVYVTTIPLTANQIIRYAKYEVVGGTHYANLAEMEIWGDPSPPVNLAPLHGVASANYTYVGYPPSNAIDANRETHWGATYFATAENPTWLQVNLQKTYKVDQIVLVFLHTTNHSGQTNVYNLYTSADGITWNLVSSGTLVDSLDPAVYVTTIPLAANQIIRYAKYEVVGGTHYANLAEIEIWGDPSPATSSIIPPLFLLLD